MMYMTMLLGMLVAQDGLDDELAVQSETFLPSLRTLSYDRDPIIVSERAEFPISSPETTPEEAGTAEAPQDPGEQEPLPRPLRLEEPIRRIRPAYPLRSGIRARALFIHPRTTIRTDEYQTQVFSGEVELQSRTGLPSWGLGGAFEVELGKVTLSSAYFQLSASARLDRDVSYEDDTFHAGETIYTESTVAWLDAYYAIPLYGSVSKDGWGVELLAGIHAARLKTILESDQESANEGFNALWPVPAGGVRLRTWLTDRVSVHAQAVGTFVKYTNPFHTDSGKPQDIEYSNLRVEVGAVADLSRNWSVGLGVTWFQMHVSAASVEDTDQMWMEGLGGFLSFDYRF